jgi:glycosyltransferase involved in cell wall biosynthesis
MWHGVRRVFIRSKTHPMGTIAFDWASTWRASRSKGVVLTLGYNTGALNSLYRLRRVQSVMNMDGIEWKREKWSLPQRTWLWLNEWAGARAANHLIADHPEIARHLQRHTSAEKITVIPYGADALTSAPIEPIIANHLLPKAYDLLIARPEPENSITEIIRAYSLQRRRIPLVVLGKYTPEVNQYHRRVLDMAGPDVRFLGSIYDREIVTSLRFHARAYIHGHRVGGTNPSLVESMAAGNAIIAHDNRFTRWVAGPGAKFFKSSDDLAVLLASLEAHPDQLNAMETASRKRHAELFTQEKVLFAYEKVLMRFCEA